MSRPNNGSHCTVIITDADSQRSLIHRGPAGRDASRWRQWDRL